MKGDDKVVADSTENTTQATMADELPEKTGSDEKSDNEERQEIRGEQGTSSGDPHDDTDPQSG